MQTTLANAPISEDKNFIERRNTIDSTTTRPERRQFASSHDDLSPDAKELALAIDSYKLQHRRRYITFEEMLCVVKDLGYSR